jgi:choline kinase
VEHGGGAMKAILLAAGRGRRLESDAPKCLLEIAGKTLLERHLENLAAAGVTDLTIVVGYEQAQIRDFVATRTWPIPVRFVENDRFVRGSIVSLGVAIDSLVESGGIWMDADVLYPAELMRRLVESKHANCVLLDSSSEETGEEMMLGVRGGRVLRVARRVSPEAPWDLVGEAVGFAKVGPAGAAEMKRILDEEIHAGKLDQEYEAAMNLCFATQVWGFELVSDLAWTEIDFREDVEKATRIATSPR